MTSIPPETAKQEALIEFSALGDNLPDGMYVFPSEVFRWSGVLVVHRGYYQGSVLHFTVVIPPTYPARCPSIVFDSPSVFHPLVDPVSGEMRLDSRFPTWHPRRDFVAHVLHFVKSAFKRRALDDLREALCPNAQAYRLYREQPTVFAKLAAQSAKLSISPSVLYSQEPPSRTTDPNPSPFRFRKLRDDVERETLSREVSELATLKTRPSPSSSSYS